MLCARVLLVWCLKCVKCRVLVLLSSSCVASAVTLFCRLPACPRVLSSGLSWYRYLVNYLVPVSEDSRCIKECVANELCNATDQVPKTLWRVSWCTIKTIQQSKKWQRRCHGVLTLVVLACCRFSSVIPSCPEEVDQKSEVLESIWKEALVISTR